MQTIKLLTFAALTATLLVPAHADPKEKFIVGESASLAGGTVSTWARVNGGGKVVWVGLTIPLSMVENMPEPGSGPASSVAVLDYPAVVQQTTYFNHVEIHSNLHGHPANAEYANTLRYMVPHFDFHFFGIPEAAVWNIPIAFAPLESVPAERLPVGYAQPEEFSVPQMGRHSEDLSEFTATDHWLLTMVAGFVPDASYMHFIEPMITQEFLLRREGFTLPIPTPAVLGRATRYPTECEVKYDNDIDAFHFVFKGFESIE